MAQARRSHRIQIAFSISCSNLTVNGSMAVSRSHVALCHFMASCIAFVI